jgi:hypothetical protein
MLRYLSHNISKQVNCIHNNFVQLMLVKFDCYSGMKPSFMFSALDDDACAHKSQALHDMKFLHVW